MITKLALLVCVLTALAAAGSAQAEIVTNASIPLSLAVAVPCANGGAGETVQLSGSLQVVDLLTFDAGGGIHLAFHANPQDVSGVGLTTGTRYRGTGVTLGNLNLTAGIQSTLEDNFLLIAESGGGSLRVHETMVLVVSANGTLAAAVANVSITCV